MKTKKFYRFEREDSGKGPYRCGSGNLLDSCDDYENDNNHPSPLEDSKLQKQMRRKELLYNGFWSTSFTTEGDRYSFGFSSKKQLRAWFYNDVWLSWMADNGFILAEILSEEYIVGNAQAMFVKPEDGLYQKHNIKEFFKLP